MFILSNIPFYHIQEERLHTNMCDDESGRHINTLHQDHLLREHPKRRPAQQDSTNASRELRREVIVYFCSLRCVHVYY